jgi:hypothetical protein
VRDEEGEREEGEEVDRWQLGRALDTDRDAFDLFEWSPGRWCAQRWIPRWVFDGSRTGW